MTDPNKPLFADGRSLEAESGMVWLAEAEIPSSPLTRIRLTSNNESLNFGQALDGTPNVYWPYPMKVGVISRSKSGDIPQLQVTISNTARDVMEYMVQYNGLVGQPAAIRLISLSSLEDYDNQLPFLGEIVTSEASHESVTFAIGRFNVKQLVFPRRRFVAHHCRFPFGGPECGYDRDHPLATYSICGRTYNECVTRGDDEELVMGVARQHPERFGGWRSIPVG
ncbi:MAG: hypothetical protein HKO76_02620 [Acidimicrobiia bacterium]|nr:hypothetical protein [Acidimicrobiia bacterium]